MKRSRMILLHVDANRGGMRLVKRYRTFRGKVQSRYGRCNTARVMEGSVRAQATGKKNGEDTDGSNSRERPNW